MKGICFALVIASLTSCLNSRQVGTVKIAANQTIFEATSVTGVGGPFDSVKSYTTNEPIRARLTLPQGPNDPIKIAFVEAYLSKITPTGTPVVWQSGDPATKGFYVPSVERNLPAGLPNNRIFNSVSFKYTEFTPTLQTFSVPLKLRPGIRDTIKSAASASFNIGFAYAFKHTVNKFKKIYWNSNGTVATLNNQTTKITYAYGPFLGPTIVDLKSTNTDGIAVKDRSVVGATYGAFGMIGYNQINAGLAIGFDDVFNTEKGSWIYNRRPWIGIIVALDLIK